MRFSRVWLAAAAACFLAGPALPDDEGFGPAPELRPYLRQAASAAAVASAVALVEDCRAPLEFEPGNVDEFTTLVISCADTPDETRQVTLVFRVHPRAGDFAFLEPVETRLEPAEDW